MTIKLKSSIPPASPFSFDIFSDSNAEPASIPSPPTSWLSARDMKVFGARPLTATSEIGVVKCKECAKPILRSSMAEHAGACVRIRAGSTKGKTDLDGSKKRKASPSPEEPAKKKTKPIPKGTTKGRVKGPIDLDKHCGVINDKGLPCSRSLTCKSHSMGSKRSVLGRSRKYDDLLLDWQRANNPNFVEPVKRETKAEKKEKREKEKQEKKRLAEEAAAALGLDITKKPSGTSSSKKVGKKAAAAAAAAVRLADEFRDDGSDDLDDLDSEVEIEDMISNIKIGRERGTIGVPLAVPSDPSSWFVSRRERARCCRDLLLNALGSGGGTAVNSGVGPIGMVSRSASMSSTTRNIP
ncbi:SCA7, zinc-binding domain-containing protein [Crepidotus variabilis]|uniref:SCA7, zinc-binding domain-containing protein n=1 Tax=Crepidotus variabilis TaxID=179855 RepID=A0A9P6EBD3_9AGAR|nr:SCA7, zinc-binding domain-containing protein [Crepidotus variabilis]